MNEAALHTRGIIVETLLQVAHRVVEVASSHVISAIWDRPGATFNVPPSEFVGKKISDVRNNTVFARSEELIEAGFKTGESKSVEYTTIGADGLPVTYSIRVVLCHPDKNYLFLTSEILQHARHPELVDDKWKLALDAAGDGIWDMHITAGRIFFSPKWHEIFGYNAGEIVTVEDWYSKIHPDDYSVAHQSFTRHLSGEASNYVAELRYRCKDGSYKWILSRGIIAAKAEDGTPLRFIGTHIDIDRRKSMELEHQSNLNLLLKLIDSLPSAIIVTDEHKKIVFTNHAFCNRHSAVKYKGQIIGADGDKSIQEDKLLYQDPDAFVARVEDIARAREMVLNEELNMADGRIVSRDYIPLDFREGYKGEIWKFTDITAQKNIDNRFEKQRLFYEHILTSMPTNINAVDNMGRFLYINPNSIKDDEFRDWCMGKTLREIHEKLNTANEQVERWIGFFDTALTDKKKVEWTDEVVLEDGSPGYMLRCFSPILSSTGEVDMVIGYGVDITDRVLAEQALKASMDAFAHSFNFSGIGKALLAPGGKWLEVNDIVCRLTGYTREELQEMHYRDITYPEDMEVDVPYILQLLNKEIESYTIEKRYVSKSRQIIVTSLTVTLLWNPDNTPKYFICDVIDITAKKVLTDELYRQNAELEATKANLINKIHQLEEVSHLIAHNLKWPAANIKLLAERLQVEGESPMAVKDGYTRDEALSILYKSSIALNNSLNTLIELSDIRLNKKIAYNDCDFAVLAKGIIRQLQRPIYEKHAQIHFKLAVAAISYPKVYLESILYNLISNAVKYSNPENAPVITIATKMVDGRVCLTVKDNGLGLDLKKDGGNLFRLNKVFHQGFDSRGVGLFLTKSHVESLGGSIAVKSKKMEGSEFIVMF